MSVARERPWTGRTVLFLMLAFFGVILYFATSSWNGLAIDDAYRKGLAYNETIERAAAQRSLGWRTSVSLDEISDGHYRLAVLLRDRAGQPIDGRSVAATLRHPIAEAADVETALNWAGAGRYTADVALPHIGVWDVRIEIERGSELPYLIESRLWPN